MKKSTKLMALLAALCLVTSSFVGSTLAKYVTSGTGTDSARVAKFGVKIVADGTMFSDSYKNAKTTYTENEEGNAITVQADTEGENVVAPGTEGNLAALAVTGTPEVDVEVTYDATLDLGNNWMVDVTDDGDDNPVFYCPIRFLVQGAGAPIEGRDYSSAAELKAAVEAAIEGRTATYDTNTDLSAVNDDLQVSWLWEYSTNDGAYDAKDTALGDAAAAGTPANIALTVTTTITQVD